MSQSLFQNYKSLLSTRLIKQERGWSRRLSWWSWNRGCCHPAFVAFHLSHCWTVDIWGRTAPRYEGHLDGWYPQTPTRCERILVWGPRPGLPITSRPNLWDYLVAEGDDGPLRSPHVMEGVVGILLTARRLPDATELNIVGEHVLAVLTNCPGEGASRFGIAGRTSSRTFLIFV